MAKRGAQRDINHDNWDQEEEPEEAGVFKQAPKDVLKTREIKKAKRRGGEGDEGVAKTPSLFKGFAGFTSNNPKPTFSFNTDGSKPLAGLTNGGGTAFSLRTTAITTTSFALGTTCSTTFAPTEKKDTPPNPPPFTEAKAEASATNGSTQSKSKYLSQLRALNESVAKWISDHVSKNNTCILTPIFKDYEKHLSQIELLNPDKKSDAAQPKKEEKKEEKKEADKPAVTDAPKPFSFGYTSGFNFPSSSTSQTLGTSSSSIFGKDVTSTSSGTGFTFNSFASVAKPPTDNKPFSFAMAANASSGEVQKKEDDEEYQPPKPEVQEIQEEGAFYTKRCKLYYQKDGQWVDRGVGNLHLKSNDEKTQLLVRADTNLGNILLNINLAASIPMARQGKNNVSLTCIVNPPIDPKQASDKPTAMLIKVKTEADADELFKKLTDNKK